MEPLLEQARAKSILIIHAPSETMSYYTNAPGRALAQRAVRVDPLTWPLGSVQIEVRFETKKREKQMSRGKHTEAQMIEALKQVEGGRSVEEVGRHYGVSKHTIYGWKAKYGGMDVSEAQEVKQLRDENTRLKKLVADLSLDKDMLQSVIRKNSLGSWRDGRKCSGWERSLRPASGTPASWWVFRDRAIDTEAGEMTACCVNSWSNWRTRSPVSGTGAFIFGCGEQVTGLITNECSECIVRQGFAFDASDASDWPEATPHRARWQHRIKNGLLILPVT
jgi:putative transposase